MNVVKGRFYWLFRDFKSQEVLWSLEVMVIRVTWSLGNLIEIDPVAARGFLVSGVETLRDAPLKECCQKSQKFWSGLPNPEKNDFLIFKNFFGLWRQNFLTKKISE